MKETVILVNCGHGGIDPTTKKYTTPAHYGKRFTHKGYPEFHNGETFYEGVSNRVLGMKYIELAAAQGIICYPLFAASEDKSLMRLINEANNYYDNINKNCRLLSFHSNAFKSYSRGFQVYHYPTSKEGRRMARINNKHIEPIFVDYGSTGINPIRPANFAMLRATRMPANLYEFGFFDNLHDARLLMQEGFVNDIMQAAVNATIEIIK